MQSKRLFVSGLLTILEPSPPETNCSLTYVPEVGPVDCLCSTVSLGSPAGRLQWLVGNDVIVSGGYGVTQLPFPTNSVNRTHDGIRVTCQVDWVVKQSVFVTDKVACELFNRKERKKDKEWKEGRDQKNVQVHD